MPHRACKRSLCSTLDNLAGHLLDSSLHTSLQAWKSDIVRLQAFLKQRLGMAPPPPTKRRRHAVVDLPQAGLQHLPSAIVRSRQHLLCVHRCPCACWARVVDSSSVCTHVLCDHGGLVWSCSFLGGTSLRPSVVVILVVVLVELLAVVVVVVVVVGVVLDSRCSQLFF